MPPYRTRRTAFFTLIIFSASARSMAASFSRFAELISFIAKTTFSLTREVGFQNSDCNNNNKRERVTDSRYVFLVDNNSICKPRQDEMRRERGIFIYVEVFLVDNNSLHKPRQDEMCDDWRCLRVGLNIDNERLENLKSEIIHGRIQLFLHCVMPRKHVFRQRRMTSPNPNPYHLTLAQTLSPNPVTKPCHQT
jgi:hypothetical protein